ncbi:hypothetical protein [Ureibacillus manganicus]|uniref:DUF3953 domain-containing protein n=1 Tax=Ureibacillus manganicus DSM 26584 TaxID=1384049 RepID=A0A0A3IW58_9BACL|nr:hypothetical protein [Ureibacillus manganicus]KGR79062.1 hypothetical protein CD29_08640 [Ureibacillus manganicus DSM 26584]
MKRFSISSIVLIFIGLLFFILNWLIDGYVEPIVLTGVIFILLGVVFSFIAISKREKGSLKYISIATFFIILFLVTWFDPIQVLRMMTWFKNII